MPETYPWMQERMLTLGSWAFCNMCQRIAEKSLLLTREQLKSCQQDGQIPFQNLCVKIRAACNYLCPFKTDILKFSPPSVFSKKMESDFISAMYRLCKYWNFCYGGNLLCFLVSSLLRKDWSIFGPFPEKGENPTKSSIHFYRWPHYSSYVIWKENV